MLFNDGAADVDNGLMDLQLIEWHRVPYPCPFIAVAERDHHRETRDASWARAFQ